MARILVTGAPGFLGRHVCAALGDHDVLAVGRTVAVDAHNLTHALEAWSPREVAGVIASFGPDALINCAGATGGESELLVAANVQVVATLLDAAATAAPGARIVQLGSAAEYSVERAGATSQAATYAETKHAATDLVLRARDAGTVDGVVLRLFNPVGPGMSESTLPGRAAVAMRDALDGGERTIRLGDLSAARDFIDVRDVAAAVRSVALGDRPVVPVMDCGSGVATPARELVHTLARIAGYDGEITEDAEGSARSAGTVGRTADTRSLRDLVAWAPGYSLEDALRGLWDEVSTRPSRRPPA